VLDRVRDRRRRKRNNGRDQWTEQVDIDADRETLAQRAAREAAHDVSLLVVRGHHAVRGKEHERAHMVRYDPERCRPSPYRTRLPAFEMRDEWEQQVDPEHVGRIEGSHRQGVSRPAPKFHVALRQVLPKPEGRRRYCMNTEFPISM